MNLHQRGAHSLGLRLQVFQDPIWWLHKSGIVKLRHVTENTSLSRIECCALYKEIGKKVHFHHNKDNFCSSFFILTTNFTKSGYFSENTKPLYSHFPGKTKSFT